MCGGWWIERVRGGKYKGPKQVGVFRGWGVAEQVVAEVEGRCVQRERGFSYKQEAARVER